ncbi:hypothetical protein ACT4VM_17290 [Acinetobacter baumannii]
MKYLKGLAICIIVILILWCFKFYDQQLPIHHKQDNIELYD